MQEISAKNNTALMHSVLFLYHENPAIVAGFKKGYCR